MVDQGVDLPQRAIRAEYSDEIAKDYPFHPELLTTLNRKTSTIPNFQRTRGVLRLLAQTIRKLWQEKPKDCYLIAPFCMDLADDQTANDLTSRLDRPQYKQVIEADIASPKKGTPSHAQEIDEDLIEAGRPPYAQRIATTVFLHSLVQTGQSGVDPADLRLAVLQPDDDPSLVDKAVQRLVDRCWFFDYDGLRYRFKTEPALRKIVDDEMGMVGKIKAKTELDERIQKVWKKGTFDPEYFPAEAADLDDDAQAPEARRGPLRRGARQGHRGGHPARPGAQALRAQGEHGGIPHLQEQRRCSWWPTRIRCRTWSTWPSGIWPASAWSAMPTA